LSCARYHEQLGKPAFSIHFEKSFACTAQLDAHLSSTSTKNAPPVSFSSYGLSFGPRACQRTLSWSRHGCLSYSARASGPSAACADFCPHANAGLVWPWYACADGCHRRLRCHRIHYWSWRLVAAFWRPLRVCACRAAAASDFAAKHFLVSV